MQCHSAAGGDQRLPCPGAAVGGRGDAGTAPCMHNGQEPAANGAGLREGKGACRHGESAAPAPLERYP